MSDDGSMRPRLPLAALLGELVVGGVLADTAPRGRTRRTVQPVTPPKIKAGRNHPCPCGSGKKFKRCHGRRS